MYFGHLVAASLPVGPLFSLVALATLVFSLRRVLRRLTSFSLHLLFAEAFCPLPQIGREEESWVW
jgi:hypothetical protein